jgi:hypothetical protein
MGNRLASLTGNSQAQVPRVGAGPAARVFLLWDVRQLPICRVAGGSGFTGEICETATEGAVMLDGSAQFLGARVFAMPGG